MKHSYSRLCLKEHWTSFALLLLVGILGIGTTIYFFLQKEYMYVLTMGLIGIGSLLVSLYLFALNMRRKEIKKEYSYEFDRELFAKQRTCPRCGSSIGSNVCYCPKCGTKFH